nr:B3 domain-containing protein REM2-like [Tanacetum cinerariifolium]
MNPYFATNPNDIKAERQPNSFDVDDESDVYFLQQSYQYHETLVEDENRPVLTRNPIHRDRVSAGDRLIGDYFDEPCKYHLYYFRRRYRKSRRLFLKIVKGISTYEADPLPKHFKIRADCMGRMSLSVIMKCTAAISQLAYGTTPDALDEYLQISANNDINVLDNSSLFDDLLDDKAPIAPFVSITLSGDLRSSVQRLSSTIWNNPLLLLASIECDIVNSTQHHIDSSTSREITPATFAQPTLLRTIRENNLNDSASVRLGPIGSDTTCHGVIVSTSWEQPQLPTSVVSYRVSTRDTYYTLTVGVLQQE